MGILRSMLQSMIYQNLFNTHLPFQIDGPETVDLKAGQTCSIRFRDVQYCPGG